MSDEPVPVKVWCKGCGEVFTAFLQYMADHNAEVVCPKCGKLNDCAQSDFADSANNQPRAAAKKGAN
jgi:Zn finger protein HypA/HybF involved in hydrogenase expression